MNRTYHKPAYDILPEESGEWVPAGYEDGPDAGGSTLPKEVLDRVTEGRPGNLRSKAKLAIC